MATYTFDIILESPYNLNFAGAGQSFVYQGPLPEGTATITDNETGIDGLTLDDNIRGSAETAIATVVTPTQTFTDIPVNADAGWKMVDTVTGKEFDVVLLNGKDGPTAFTYTLSEYPLVPGRTYDVIKFDNQPNAAVADDPFFTYSEYVCFAAGMRLQTPGGWRPVEDLRPGDLVETLDNGAQPIRWVGSRKVAAFGSSAPIRIAAGVAGNDRPLLVSPNHRMLEASAGCELLFGDPEVLAAAKHLTRRPGVRRVPLPSITYVHLMFDRHELVNCEGAWAESLHPAPETLRLLSAEARDEIMALFPRLKDEGHRAFGPTARRVLRSHEAKALVAGESARPAPLRRAA